MLIADTWEIRLPKVELIDWLQWNIFLKSEIINNRDNWRTFSLHYRICCFSLTTMSVWYQGIETINLIFFDLVDLLKYLLCLRIHHSVNLQFLLKLIDSPANVFAENSDTRFLLSTQSVHLIYPFFYWFAFKVYLIPQQNKLVVDVELAIEHDVLRG